MVIIVIIAIAYVLGGFYPLNKFFMNQTPDKTCRLDSDCKYFIQPIDNAYCVGGNDCSMLEFDDTRVTAINKNWEPFCPFPKSSDIQVTQCIGGILFPVDYAIMIKCINNKCEKVLS